MVPPPVKTNRTVIVYLVFNEIACYKHKMQPRKNNSHPHRFRTVFLSRATSEFGQHVAQLKSQAVEHYPLLHVTDQWDQPVKEQPPHPQLTVEKIHTWIEKVDVMLQFVGAKAGCGWECPGSTLADVKSKLNTITNGLLNSLRQYFEERGVCPSLLSYTHLEGVMALAMGKPPYVLLLSVPDPGKIEPAQSAYRDWLKEQYTNGRDRFEHENANILVDQAHRMLADWNGLTQLERLARSSQRVTLWETIFDLSQPGADEQSVKKRWNGILNYEADSRVDWVGECIDCGETSRPLIHRDGSTPPAWLIPRNGGWGVLREMNGQWKFSCQNHNGEIRAICHDGTTFWVLLDPTSNGHFVLVNDDLSQTLTIPDLMVNHMGNMLLSKDQDNFFLDCGGSVSQMTPSTQASASNQMTIKRCDDSLAAVTIRNRVLPQFSRMASFPFRRLFRGETYEYDSCEPEFPDPIDTRPSRSWALSTWNGKIYYLVLRRGYFADAWKTVDLRMEGCWEANEVSYEDEIHWLVIRRGNAEARKVPLFPANQNPPHNQNTSMVRNAITEPGDVPPLLSSPVTNERTEISFIVTAEHQNQQPFCYLARDYNTDPKTETRLRVWLIPLLPSNEIIQELRNLMCEVKRLPETPLQECVSLDELCGRLQTEWWSLLWNNCHQQWRNP